MGSIKHPLHLNDPAHLLRAVCGEVNPLMRTSNPDDVTCNFCAYAWAKYLGNAISREPSTELRETKTIPT